MGVWFYREELGLSSLFYEEDTYNSINLIKNIYNGGHNLDTNLGRALTKGAKGLPDTFIPFTNGDRDRVAYLVVKNGEDYLPNPNREEELKLYLSQTSVLSRLVVSELSKRVAKHGKQQALNSLQGSNLDHVIQKIQLLFVDYMNKINMENSIVYDKVELVNMIFKMVDISKMAICFSLR